MSQTELAQYNKNKHHWEYLERRKQMEVQEKENQIKKERLKKLNENKNLDPDVPEHLQQAKGVHFYKEQ